MRCEAGKACKVLVYRDIARDSTWDEARTPVPAEVFWGLPNEVTARRFRPCIVVNSSWHPVWVLTSTKECSSQTALYSNLQHIARLYITGVNVEVMRSQPILRCADLIAV